MQLTVTRTLPCVLETITFINGTLEIIGEIEAEWLVTAGANHVSNAPVKSTVLTLTVKSIFEKPLAAPVETKASLVLKGPDARSEAQEAAAKIQLLGEFIDDTVNVRTPPKATYFIELFPGWEVGYFLEKHDTLMTVLRVTQNGYQCYLVGADVSALATIRTALVRVTTQ